MTKREQLPYAKKLCSMYAYAPLRHALGGHSVSCDEMTGIQALERYPADDAPGLHLHGHHDPFEAILEVVEICQW